MMLIIPAIDLRDGRCVRLTQGRRAEVKVYDGDPVEIARGFEAAGARMLHVVDLDGAFADSNATNRKVVRRIIRAVEIPVQFGGGLRTIEDVQQLDRVRRGAGRHRDAGGGVARDSWSGSCSSSASASRSASTRGAAPS